MSRLRLMSRCMIAAGVDASGIDAMFPVTEEEFNKFREALTQKILSFNVGGLTH